MPYVVQIYGPIDEPIREVFFSVSQLKRLETDPPKTMVALKRRAQADLPNLIDGLRSLGYYNACVEVDVDEGQDDLVAVKIRVEPGQVYPLLGFSYRPVCPEEHEVLESVRLSDLGIALGQVAYPAKILDAQEALLTALTAKGYPLAIVEDREVIADQRDKGIYVLLTLTLGPQVLFGPTKIEGLETVSEQVVRQRIGWREGQRYDPWLVNTTERELERTGLFASIMITEGDRVEEGQKLPMKVILSEGYHRTIGVGVNYNTQLGPGITANWEHRNIRSRGEKVSLLADLWWRKQRGSFDYIIPDFVCKNQDLKWSFEMEKERTEGFTETFYSASALVERRYSSRFRYSYGASYKQLFSSNSDNNRSFSLFKVPLHVKWSHIDQPLNPTSGVQVNCKVTPTAQVKTPQFGYVIQSLMCTGYYPYSETLVLAAKAQFGSIVGSQRFDIPPPERLYAGTESTLRGYKYMTVSPLDEENKPIGGRSLMVFSLEARIKLKDCFGWAYFYEFGNVYRSPFPQLSHRQLQSIGAGFRYYTSVGPLRADIAFPLQLRRGIDRTFQIYLSIGQAF